MGFDDVKRGEKSRNSPIEDFFGLPVTRLIRISYGPFNLGNLEKGEVREIPAKTLKELIPCA